MTHSLPWIVPRTRPSAGAKGNGAAPAPAGRRGPTSRSPAVDSKDDGVKELQKYQREHGALNTYTVSTPSGGFHYYFNYDPQNYLMTTYLTNRTKYRNCGLDIRTNGGYVVGAGSVVDGRAYEIHNRAPIGDMPDSLIAWLIESVTSESVAKSPVTKRPPKCYSQPNAEVKYVVHDHELDNILSLLPENT